MRKSKEYSPWAGAVMRQEHVHIIGRRFLVFWAEYLEKDRGWPRELKDWATFRQYDELQKMLHHHLTRGGW